MSRNLDNFMQLLAGKCEEWGAMLFSCDDIASRLDHYAETFVSSGAWKREYAKWNGNPVPLCEDIADELAYVKDWYEQNHEHLGQQMGTIITTGISDVSAQQDIGEVYALDGRRTGMLRKGVYIARGRKVVVR